MKHLFCLIFILITASGFAQKEKRPKMVRNFWDYNNSVIQSEGGYYVDDFQGVTTMKHGKWKYYDRTGTLEEERMYIKGELHGPVTLYYENGRKKAKGFFNHNKMDSLYLEWYDNGKLSVEGTYNDDQPIGKWTYYYRNGYHKMEEEIVDSTNYVMSFWKLDSTQTVKEGNGRTFIYYESTGYLQEFFTYKDGLKHGDFEEYTVRGRPYVIGQYEEDKKVGEWTFYYYLGGLDRKINYVNDKLEGNYIKYYDKGKVNVKGQFNDGRKTGE